MTYLGENLNTSKSLFIFHLLVKMLFCHVHEGLKLRNSRIIDQAVHPLDSLFQALPGGLPIEQIHANRTDARAQLFCQRGQVTLRPGHGHHVSSQLT